MPSNILFISADNKKTNGSFLSLVALASHLQEQHNCKVYVVLPTEGNGNELLEEKGIDFVLIRSYSWTRKIQQKTIIFCIKEFLKLIVNFYAILKISIFIRKHDIDIVHINDIGSYVGALSSLLINIPLVWHIRFFMEEDQGCEILYKNFGYKLIGKSNHIIAITNSIKEKFSRLIQTDKISTIYNGIDPKNYYVKEHTIFRNNHINLLIVGAIRESKGQYQAIKACKKLNSQEKYDLGLRIVGTGNKEDIDKIKKMISDLKADSYIELCGSSDNPYNYYKNSDIFLMCSQAEPFGRVTVEAMMAGCLVIGANSMGTTEILTDGETGLLYENKNIDELTKKIEFAITHVEESRKIAKKGQSYALTNFTSDKNAAEIYKLYTEIIESR